MRTFTDQQAHAILMAMSGAKGCLHALSCFDDFKHHSPHMRALVDELDKAMEMYFEGVYSYEAKAKKSAGKAG